MNFPKICIINCACQAPSQDLPDGSRSVSHPVVNGVVRVMKLRASNRAGVATTSAGGCNASFDSISLARLGDCETAPGVIQGVLAIEKMGVSLRDVNTIRGRLVRVERVPERMAAEGLVTGQGLEGKPGESGTCGGNLAGSLIAQTSKCTRLGTGRVLSGAGCAVVGTEVLDQSEPEGVCTGT